METLKKLKKHDHTLTDIIKAFIFGLVLLAPCFAILTKCLYVINNKKAYENYNYDKNLTLVQNTTQLNGGDYYQFNSTSTTYDITNNVGRRIYTDEILNFNSNNTSLVENFNKIKSFNFTYYSVNYFVCYDETNTQLYAITLSQYFVKFDFRLTNSTIETSAILPNSLYKINETTLDKAFYYAVDEMKDSELFGWTKDTAIYTAVNGMCNGLAVQDGALPVLITYWTLMTAIYIILDIVIFVFKKITHFMQ